MTDPKKCHECASEDIYADMNLWICPMCSHEWSNQALQSETPTVIIEQPLGTRDANGQLLQDGESVTVIMCKIDGHGSINLKSEYVRKA